MEKPDFDALPTFVRVVCDALAAEKKRQTANQKVLDLIVDETPNDVRALLWCVAHHAPDSVTEFPGWDFFQEWDFRFSQIERFDDVICIGANAGGALYLAAVKDGETVITDGKDKAQLSDSLNSLFWDLWEWADETIDPVLEDFVPEGEPYEWF